MATAQAECPSGCSVEPVEGKGRALIARRSYSSGQTLFLEEPLVVAQYSWNKLYGYAACDRCLRPLETVEQNLSRLLTYRPDHLAALPDQDRLSEIDQSKHVSCQAGCGARYCCATCRDQAWAGYHSLLCFTSLDETTNPLMRLDALWRSMHYPPETTSIQLIVRLMAILKSTENTNREKGLLESLSCFKAEAVDSQSGLMHKILRDDFQSQLQQLSATLANDFNFLQPAVDPFLVTAEWLTKVFTMIALNGQGVGASPFNRYVTNMQKETQAQSSEASGNSQTDSAIDELYGLLDDAVGLEFLNSEGSALYALQSACNHSCDPNAKIEFPFNNATLALVTLEPVEPGQEITISYLDECQLSRSRHSRRKELMENYLFACECPKCEKELMEGQPDVTSGEEDSEDEDMQEQ